MKYGLPLVFGFISFRMQSGILVYWVTTNIWSIGQQWIVNKMIKKEKDKAESKKRLAGEPESKSENEEKIIIKPKKKKRRK